MTKRKSKPHKTVVKATAKTVVTKSSAVPGNGATPPLIVLGFDEQDIPRGARFVDAKPDLVIKAAALMGFKVYQASLPDVARGRQKTAAGAALRQRPGVRAQHPAIAVYRSGCGAGF